MRAGSEPVMNSVLRPAWARAIVFCGAYLCCAAVANHLSSNAAPSFGFWLPSGLYVGILLLVATREWGWFLTAALIADILIEAFRGHFSVLVGINAAANSVEALLGASLVRRFVASRPTMGSLKEVVGFLVCAAGLSPMATALLWAVSKQLLEGGGSFGPTWLQWWSGDASGVLVLAPFLLVWRGWKRCELRSFGAWRRVEASVLTALFSFFVWLLFYYPGHLWVEHKYLMLPLIIWAALRFGMRGVTLVILLGAMSIAYPSMGWGAGLSRPAGSLLLAPAVVAQWFIVVLSMTGLVVAAVWEESVHSAKQLRENEEHFRLLYQNAPVAYQSLDAHGNFLEVNEVWLEMMGYTRDEVVGYWFGDFLVRTQSDLFRERFPRFKEIGQIHNLEFDMERKDGRVVTVVFEGRIGYDKQRVFHQTHCVMRNITEIKQAENALRNSELRYRTLFDEAVEGIVLADRTSGMVRDCNQAFLSLTGCDKAELMGRPLATVVVVANANGGGESSGGTIPMSGESDTVVEAQIRTKSGGKKTVEIKTKGLELDGQAVAQHFIRDVTARKAAEEERDRLFKLSMDMLCVAGFDGRFKQVNPAWKQTLGWSDQEMLARPWLDLVHSDDQKATGEAWEELRKGLPMRAFENRYLCKNGTYRWLSWNIIPLIEDKVFFAVVRDITELKRAEEDLRTLNAELERRVLERTAQLEAANKEMEAFAYSVSHDLRAPLRAVNGFSNIVIRDYAAGLDPEAARFLKLVSDNAQKMGRLIDDLLAFSRLGRQSLRKQTVIMADLVQGTLMELREEKAGRRIEVRVGDLPACQADPALIKQVWVNLLSNAFKYTRRSETAVVEIGAQWAEAGSITYFVRDNGAGFDMQYAGKLFGVFQRLHREDEFEGTGVGLAIVQRIVQRHGGRVWAEGHLNEGACFYFTLPI